MSWDALLNPRRKKARVNGQFLNQQNITKYASRNSKHKRGGAVKCVRCNRSLDKPAGYAAGRPVGRVCFRKMFGVAARVMKSVAVTLDERQGDLFSGVAA